ncbi:MAG: glycosyltransferase, partial [Eubacterium sp.]|nr:glycosyltransferase [Eubacterium sp.]
MTRTDFVRTYPEPDFNEGIFREGLPECMYAFSDLRTGILEVLDFEGTEDVLEIGSGCGTFTGFLADRCRTVTSLETDAEALEVCRIRHKDRKNIAYHEVPFRNFETEALFDLIVLVDVQEKPEDGFAEKLGRLLKENGQLVIAAENPYGISRQSFYPDRDERWQEDSLCFLSRRQILRIAEKAGLPSCRFFYPFPDHRFAEAVYSDRYLPSPGDLHGSIRNFTETGMTLLDEQAAWKRVCAEEKFPEFCNAYLAVASRKEPENQVLYVKSSKDRAPEHAILTRICTNRSGELFVEKRPAVPEAAVHVRKLEEIFDKLSGIYPKAGLRPNMCLSDRNSGESLKRCTEENTAWNNRAADGKTEAVRFAWAEGQTLEKILDDLCKDGKREEAERLFTDYLTQITALAGEPFEKTEDFVRVFGDADLPDGLSASRDGNIDLLLHNVLLPDSSKTEDGTVIDYEWTFDFPVPVRFVLYRILYYRFVHLGMSEDPAARKWYARFGISESEQSSFENMERCFQQYILGTRHTIDEIRMKLAPGRLTRTETQEVFEERLRHLTWRIFQDGECTGEGSIHGLTTADIREKLRPGVSEIDFCPFRGIGVLKSFRAEDEHGRELACRMDESISLNEGMTAFVRREPRIRIRLHEDGVSEVHITYQIVSLDDTSVAGLCTEVLREKYEKLMKGTGSSGKDPSETGENRMSHYLRKAIQNTKNYGLSDTISRAVRLMKRPAGSYQSIKKREERNQRITAWLQSLEPDENRKKEERQTAFSYRPKFSILVPLYETGEIFLDELIRSVQAQTYENWELCFSDGSREKERLQNILKKYQEKDPRILYTAEAKGPLGISSNTNQAYTIAAGDVIVLGDHDDLFACDALFECVKAMNADPEIDVLYTDEDKTDETASRFFDPVCKPDLNMELLRSCNYITHMFVVKKSIVEKTGLFDDTYNGAQDYDFILRCVEQAKKVCHIPKVLYHWRISETSTAGNPKAKTYAYEAGARALQAHYDRMGMKAKAEPAEDAGYYLTVWPKEKEDKTIRVSFLAADVRTKRQANTLAVLLRERDPDFPGELRIVDWSSNPRVCQDGRLGAFLQQLQEEGRAVIIPGDTETADLRNPAKWYNKEYLR